MSEFSESAYRFLAIAQKDFQSAVKTKRFIIFGVIFVLFALVGAYYGNVDVARSIAPISGAPNPATQPVNYAISVSYSYSEAILTILALALSYDALTGERSARTLVQLAVRPIKRIQRYFLASSLLISQLQADCLSSRRSCCTSVYPSSHGAFQARATSTI